MVYIIYIIIEIIALFFELLYCTFFCWEKISSKVLFFLLAKNILICAVWFWCIISGEVSTFVAGNLLLHAVISVLFNILIFIKRFEEKRSKDELAKFSE